MHDTTPAERGLAARLLNEREKQAIVALLVTVTEACAAASVHLSVRQFQRVLDDIRAKLDARPLFALGAECQRLGLIDWDAVERERERERAFDPSPSLEPAAGRSYPPAAAPRSAASPLKCGMTSFANSSIEDITSACGMPMAVFVTR